MTRRPVAFAFLIGALGGAAFFFACTLPNGGVWACVGSSADDAAFRLANLPARALESVWPNGAVAPQQAGAECVRARAEAFGARAFILWSAGTYSFLGGALAALGRFVLGGISASG